MMKNYVTIVLVSLLLFPLSTFGQWGEDSAKFEANPIEITKSVLSKKDPQGLQQLQIYFRLADGHKAYLERFKLEAKDKKIDVKEFYASPVVNFYDPVTKSNKEGVKGTGQIQASIKIDGASAPYEFEFGYQICTEKLCYLPQKSLVSVKAASDSSAFSLEHTFNQKSYVFILLAVFFAGLLTSFTPCVFPIIPLTISALGAGRELHSHLKGFLLSITYVLGMALTYSALGLFAASTGALFGSLLGHPMVVSGLALIFIIMALSSFGYYEIKAPDFIANKFTNKKTGSGFMGAFLMGILAGVVAGPCVGPILVSILTYVAKQQDLLNGFVLLFTYAFGMGQLFIVIGTFSQVTKKLPRSGSWMEFINFVFGITLLGMAVFIVSPVLEQMWVKLLVAAIFIFSGFQLGVFKFEKSKNQFEKFKKVFAATLLILGLSFMGNTIYTTITLKPEHHATQKTSNPYKVKWQKYSDEILQQAQAENRPVVIDFYADWCAACKELDEKTFSTKEVQDLTKDFFWLKFDATEGSEEFNKLKEKYGIIGLPHVVFIDKNGDWLKDKTLTGFEEKPEFLERIQPLTNQ